jgi:hypothetical protein
MPKRKLPNGPKGAWPPVRIYDEGTDDWSEIQSHHWWPLREPRIGAQWINPEKVQPQLGLARARRRALRIVRRIGLDVEFKFYAVFRDESGRWWAYPIGGRDALPELSVSPVDYWIILLGVTTAEDLPTSFSAALGGIDGPLDWALTVLALCESFPEVRTSSGTATLGFADGVEIGLALGRYADFHPKRPRNQPLIDFLTRWLNERDPEKKKTDKSLAEELIQASKAEPPTPLRRKLEAVNLPGDPNGTYLQKKIAEIRRTKVQ